MPLLYIPQQWSDNWIGKRMEPEYSGPLASAYFNYRTVTICGGSNEIQRNIIAQPILGL